MTNTPSFDIPIDNVTQNLAYGQFLRKRGQPQGYLRRRRALPAAAPPAHPTISITAPVAWGKSERQSEAARQVQMSLSLYFLVRNMCACRRGTALGRALILRSAEKCRFAPSRRFSVFADKQIA